MPGLALPGAVVTWFVTCFRSYDRETLAVHFTWCNRPGPVGGAVRVVVAPLSPFDAGPHCGSLTAYRGETAEPLAA